MKKSLKALVMGSLLVPLALSVWTATPRVQARPSIFESSSESRTESGEASDASASYEERELDSETPSFKTFKDQLRAARSQVKTIAIQGESDTYDRETREHSRYRYDSWQEYDYDEDALEFALVAAHDVLKLNDRLGVEYYLVKQGPEQYRQYSRYDFENDSETSYIDFSFPFSMLSYQHIIDQITLASDDAYQVRLRDQDYVLTAAVDSAESAALFGSTVSIYKTQGTATGEVELVFDQATLTLKSATFRYEDEAKTAEAHLTTSQSNAVAEADLEPASWTESASNRAGDASDASAEADGSNESDASDTPAASREESSSRSAAESTEAPVDEEVAQTLNDLTQASKELSTMRVSLQLVRVTPYDSLASETDGYVSYNQDGKINGYQLTVLSDSREDLDKRLFRVYQAKDDDTYYGYINDEWVYVSGNPVDIEPNYHSLIQALNDPAVKEALTVTEESGGRVLTLNQVSPRLLTTLGQSLQLNLNDYSQRDAVRLAINLTPDGKWIQQLTLRAEESDHPLRHFQEVDLRFDQFNQVPDQRFELPAETKDAKPFR